MSSKYDEHLSSDRVLMMKMQKNILVTGAAGFLGSHLVQHHLAAGDAVCGVDNFVSSLKNSKHHLELCKSADYRFFELDVCSPAFVGAFDGFDFDVIYNFACPASPPKYQSMPVETTLTCVLGTNHALTLAGASTVVVHASTSEVYGDPTETPQSESYRGNVNSYGPRSCYDEGKRAAEALCYDHKNFLGKDVRLVRIFNTYGPQMDALDGRVITNFINQVLSGRALTVYGAGSQTRSFCYVSDLVSGIVKLASLGANPGTPVNLGNPNEFTILELAKKVQERFGCPIEFKPLPVDDPLQRKPDISLAKSLLGWSPVVQLEEGLDKTIDYFKRGISL